MLFLLFSILVAAIISVLTGFDLSLDNPSVLYPNTVQTKFTTKCYPDVGCFYTGPPWYHPLYRPVAVPPNNTVEILYLLYTRKNKKEYFKFYPKKHYLKKSNYKRGKPVKVLVHGYTANYHELEEIKNELLMYADLNVFLIDYSKVGIPPYYQAVANARVVAARVAKLLKFLKRHAGLKSKDIHLVGKSLGGQIVGLIGARVKRIGRITGLDPAGPYFYHTAKETHLDMSDAKFVDSIHTNIGTSLYQGLGIFGPIGHADFYANGGNHMPECDRKQVFNLTVTYGNLVANQCDHDGSQRYFNSSIRLCKGKYEAKACFSYNGFLQGYCDKQVTNQMGLFATKPKKYPMQYFIQTAKEDPHCQVKK